MTRGGRTCLIVALAGSMTIAATRADEPPKKPDAVAQAAPGTIAARFAAIVAEFEAAQSAARAAAEKAKTDYEGWKIYGQKMPSVWAFSTRMVDLAATDPKDRGARDALLWVLDQPGIPASGTYTDDSTRAAMLLVRHHSDDPDVARLGLGLDNLCSVARDLFLEGLVLRTTNHEAKGLARLALAQYLVTKENFAAGARKAAATNPTPRATFRVRTYNDSGKQVEQEISRSVEEREYELMVRQCDPETIHAEAKRLLEEVIKDYGDVPCRTRRTMELEALLKQPNPTWNGQPLKPEDRKRVEQILARKKTLADVAKAKLDEMENLVAGKPAPPIDGTGMDGKPLKLSDYRGKVVVLVFWGTWCGPCMAEVPNERAMAEKFQSRPFAILGVDCDGDKAAALKVMAREKITWPNWNDGDPGEGPIAKRYHVHSYPSSFVIDAKGIIRHVHLRDSSLEKAVEKLLDETETKRP